MNGNLAGGGFWGADIWADINRVIATEVRQSGVVQKVFPTTLVPGAVNVPSDILAVPAPPAAPLAMVEGLTTRFVEISTLFQLTSAQASGEAVARTGRRLARLAATPLALAEDLILLQGFNAVPPIGNALPPAVLIANALALQPGLVWSAANAAVIPAPFVPVNFVGDVVVALTTLAGLGQPGPYALLLPNGIYGALHLPVAGLGSPADGIRPLVTGGFYPTPALTLAAPPALAGNYGLLASLGGEPVSIYVGSEPQADFTQVAVTGDLQFRVSERVQYIVRAPQALYRFRFM